MNFHVSSMYKTSVLIFVSSTVLLLSFSAIRIAYTEETTGTEVGGIIWEDTTWTLENSPYTITDTVQIPEGITLTIEPGVTVITSRNIGFGQSIFYFYGTIYAHGTSDNKITFDGGRGQGIFFNMDSVSSASLDLEYCIIKNAFGLLQHGRGFLSLKHSELIKIGFPSRGIAGSSQIDAWTRDVYIEKNIFLNTGGFSVGNSPGNVYLRYNRFISTASPVIWCSSGSGREGKTIVKYNSFIDPNYEFVLRYFPKLYATENYWGTQDTDVIDSMIYDRNDDINCPGFIDYMPILTEPHPDTPKISTTISCSVSPSSLTIGDYTTILGSISPTMSNVTVTLGIKYNEGSWSELTTVTTDSNGDYSYSWTPETLGSYEVKASWGGYSVYDGATSDNVSVKVTKIQTNISCSVTPSESPIGNSVIVSGSLSPAVSDANITLTYTIPDYSTFNRTVISLANGSYRDEYTPPVLGLWSISASWGGDATHRSASSESACFTVSKISSTLSCSVSASSLPIGDPITVSGSISPAVSASATIQISTDDGATWNNLTTVTTDSDGSYSYAWTPTTVGSYQLKASWKGDSSYKGATSTAVSVTVSKISTTISCTSSPSEVTEGNLVTVSGSISPAVSGKTVMLTYKKPDGSTLNRTLTTGSYGSYIDTYEPDSTDTWKVTARWNGDENHKGATSSTKSFEVKKKGICMIATATYGSELNPEVQFLRSFRDNIVLNSFAGKNFMAVFNIWYYSFSPSVASIIATNNAVRGFMKILLYPLIGILHLAATSYSLFSFNTELAVLFSGLVSSSLIALVYFAPLVLILYLFKKVKIPTKVIHTQLVILVSSIGFIGLAEVGKLPGLMMFSTAIFILTSISIISITSVKFISEHLISARAVSRG